MSEPSPTSPEAQCVLRAMHAVATSNGRRLPLPIERELLVAVQHTVLGSRLDVDALAPVSPAELRARVPGADARTWLVRCAILVPYVSLEIDTAKVTVLDALAMQLGLAPELLHDLHARRLAQASRVARDQARRGAPIYPTVHASQALHALVATLRAHRGDPALARRWQSLAALPAGSLGRALLDFHRAHRLPLPGEPGGLDESLVERDLLRLLGGFAFDETGEQGLNGFVAGLARLPMGRSLLLDAVAERCTATHLSGALARGVRPQLDLATFGAAYDRGVAASAALGRAWSWWSVLGEDVGALRLRYGVRVARTTRPAAAAERPLSAPRAA